MPRQVKILLPRLLTKLILYQSGCTRLILYMGARLASTQKGLQVTQLHLRQLGTPETTRGVIEKYHRYTALPGYTLPLHHLYIIATLADMSVFLFPLPIHQGQLSLLKLVLYFIYILRCYPYILLYQWATHSIQMKQGLPMQISFRRFNMTR